MCPRMGVLSRGSAYALAAVSYPSLIPRLDLFRYYYAVPIYLLCVFTR